MIEILVFDGLANIAVIALLMGVGAFAVVGFLFCFLTLLVLTEKP
jgi:hypothetical protein